MLEKFSLILVERNKLKESNQILKSEKYQKKRSQVMSSTQTSELWITNETPYQPSYLGT